MRLRAAAAALVAAGLLTGCAGATVGSGVGDAHLERAPYYAGGSRMVGVERVAYVPVAYQPGAAQAPIFDPEAAGGSPVATLLHAINAYLDSLAVDGLGGPVEPPAGTPPDVQFGCEPDPTGDCLTREESTSFGSDNPTMRLAVARPSGEWTAGAAAVLEEAGADALLLLTLEVGQYWTRQTNWRGSKEVELGSGHSVGLPWLTSLDTPVSVLQLTGALVGPDGKAIRIGAEGLRARRTPLLISGIGGQTLISDEDVAALMSARREDLPGQPLVWQAAVRTLVSELTGRW